MGLYRRGKVWWIDYYYPPGRDGKRIREKVGKKDDARIVRVSDVSLGHGDDFCTVWHLFDLLPEGPDGWGPNDKYAN